MSVLSTWSVAGVLAMAVPALAGAAGGPVYTNDGFVSYEVRAGDKLQQLVERYMSGADAQRRVVEINRLSNPGRLAVGQVLLLPRDRLRHVPVQAKVSKLSCTQLTEIRGDQSRPLRLDDLVDQGTVLRVPSACQAVLSIEGAGMLSLPAGASLRLAVLRRNALEPSPEVQIELLDGRINIEVQRRGLKDAPFNVRTPTSVAGIRGTVFRIDFDGQSRQTRVEVTQGVVGARGLKEAKEALVGAGQGVVITAEGRTLDVETLPPLPRVTAMTAATSEWRAAFERADSVSLLRVERSEHVNGSGSTVRELPGQEDLVLGELTTHAVFLILQTQTAGGLRSERYPVALCRATGTAVEVEPLRCHVRFDLASFQQAHLSLLRAGPGPQVTVIDAPVQSRVAIIRGLTPGEYRWQIRTRDEDGRELVSEGQFELMAAREP